jgi:hypothetical protein
VESTARPRTGRGAVVGWSVEGERRRSGDGAGEGVLRALKTTRRRREEEKRER